MDPKMYGAWRQDADSSWFMNDTDGTLLRVSRVFDDPKYHWVLAWTEKADSRLRIGTMAHASAHAAMDHANATIVLAEMNKHIDDKVKALAAP